MLQIRLFLFYEDVNRKEVFYCFAMREKLFFVSTQGFNEAKIYIA